MSELAITVERFRLVKSAYLDFITLWALDCALEKASVTDRIYREVMDVEESGFFCRSGLYRLGGSGESAN
jgi:hypothetical protein